MAKTTATPGDTAQPFHTRSTAGTDESQVFVLGEDGTDNVAALATGLLAGTERGLVVRSMIQGAPQPNTTGAITTATSTVTTGSLGLANVIGVAIYGTYAGVNVIFEASWDNVLWNPIQGARLDTGVPQSASGVLTANSTNHWSFTFSGVVYFRVRATAWTSGSASVAIDPGTLAMAPVVSAITSGAGAATSAVTNTAASAANVTLKAANANRKALYIFNAGTATLFAKLGATATTTTSYTFAIPPNGFWELPDDPIYTGIVDGIWSATGGNGALVTELT